MTTDYISALNVGSGLDTKTIVKAIVDAERVPKENIIQKKIDARTLEISAFSEVKSKLTASSSNVSLYDGINGLAVSNTGTNVTAAITNPALASSFSNEINVTSLAKRQTLAFSGFSSPTTSIGTGTLSFSFGTWNSGSFTANGTSSSVSITTGNDTLDGIAAKINDANMGVTASVIKENESQYALAITSNYGASNAMRISVTEDDASTNLDSLAYESYNASIEKVASANAVFTVDGVQISRSTNTITDVIDGISLSLSGTTSSAETVSASYDTNTALLAAQGIVAELNEIVTDLNAKIDRGGNGGIKGALAGDPLIRSLINQIKAITTEEIQGFGYSGIYLANYGILTNRDGSISLNTTTFKTEYEKDPDKFNAIVNSRVTTGSSLVSGEVSNSDYTPGSYQFTLSGSSATIGGANMSLSDGVYYTSTGSTRGLKVSLNGAGTSTTINMGLSFIDKFKNFAEETLKFGNDIDSRVTVYNTDLSTYADELSDFQQQMDDLSKMYSDQFAAMDLAIAKMNSTKESLNSMMDAWKGSLSK